MNRKSRLIAFSAVIIALIVILAPIPFVFLVPLLTVTVLFGFRMTIISSLAFGIVSLMYSFLGGGSPVSAAFIAAPWIPIIPRLVVGLSAHSMSLLMNKVIKSQSLALKILKVSIPVSIGSILNTVLVVACLILFVPDVGFNGVTTYIYAPTMLILGIIELVVCNIVIPPLCITLSKVMKKF